MYQIYKHKLSYNKKNESTKTKYKNELQKYIFAFRKASHIKLEGSSINENESNLKNIMFEYNE